MSSRSKCPECNTPVPMAYVFPAPKANPCAERNASRFQLCHYCGWSGDVLTGEVLIFWRHGQMLVVNGTTYERGFLGFLIARGICVDPDADKKEG